MINFKKYILRLLSFGFLFMFSASCSVFADFRFAKIVVLGVRGSGKTSVIEVLTKKQNSIEDPDHTDNLDIKERVVEIDGSFVNEKLWDTSAEPRHLGIISDFCRNATVAIIVIDMEEFSKGEYKPEYAEKITNNWCDTLNEVAPNCRLVILGTKKDKLENHAFRLDQAEKNIERIAECRGIAEKVEGRVEFISAQRDNPQQLYETIVHRIDEAIRSYGVQNLPTSPKNLLARIVKTVPKKRVKHKVKVPYAGTVHYSGTVTDRGSVASNHTVLIWPINKTDHIPYSKDVDYSGDEDYNGEADYEYETFEDDNSRVIYELEYYGDSF